MTIISGIMKTKTHGLAFLFILFLSSPLFPQYIVFQDEDKIEVWDINGSFITSGYYSGMKDIAQGDNIILLWYNSDKVEIRSYDLTYLTSAYYSGLKKVSATQDYVVLHYVSGKVEVRDKDLRHFCSWYQ